MDAGLWLLLAIGLAGLVRVWYERRQDAIERIARHLRRDYAGGDYQ